MGLFDLILVIIIGGFALFGFWFGFFHTLGSLVGTVAGVFLASRYYEPVAHWLVETTGWGENLSSVIMFTFAFILINRLVGFVFWGIDRLLNIVTRLPFIKSLNRFAGLALGIFEGFVTVGFVVYIASRFPFSDWLSENILNSFISPIALDVIEFLLPLLPEGLRMIQQGADVVEQAV